MRNRLIAIGKACLLAALSLSLLWSARVTFADFLNGLNDRFQEHLLATIAIFAGVVAVFFELQLHKGFEHQRDDIRKVVSEMTTRYLGEWPKHLSYAADLARSVEQGNRLCILVDQIGYGSLSQREEFEAYFEALKAAAHRATIHLLTYPEQAVKTVLHHQFDEHKDRWEHFASSEKVKAFVERYGLEKPRDCNQFVDGVLSVHNWFYQAMDDASKIGGVFAARTLSAPSPNQEVFCWILLRGDEPKQMVFAYPRFSGAKTGHAFFTRDLHLMMTFMNEFTRKWGPGESQSVSNVLYPSVSIAQPKTATRHGSAAKT
jgi:hypothetical protein